MIKRAVAPVGGRVALITRGRESSLDMIRVRRTVVVVLVAVDTRSTGELVVVVHVALRALQRRMRTGESKTRRRVIEGSIRP